MAIYFKLVEIVVLHPYDNILNYISAKKNTQRQSIINSSLAQRKRDVTITQRSVERNNLLLVWRNKKHFDSHRFRITLDKSIFNK